MTAPAPLEPGRRRWRLPELPELPELTAGSMGWWRVAGWLVLAVSSAQLLHRYLLAYPGELWQLDLEVYRDGAVSLLTGRPVYDHLSGAPQFLPFTYPPFAAVLLLPLAFVPFTVAGWVWSLAQVVLVWFASGIAFRPLIHRLAAPHPERAPLWQGVVAAVVVHLWPVADGVRFGQMNAVIVGLCLADAGRRAVLGRPEGGPWWPAGSLTGIATAIKLTPAVFWVHYAVARRWRALLASVATAALVTTVTAAAAPSTSAAYWLDALLDPERLGPNDNTSNQSLRGALLRLLPHQPGLQKILWLMAAGAVLVLGLALSTRLDRVGQPVAAVGAVGMVAVLVSPVSWIHHWHWGIAVLGGLLGDARVRSRVIATLGLAAVLMLPAPWWGGPGVVGRVVQQSYTLVALLSLFALWWLVARGAAQSGVGTPAADSSVSTASSAQTMAPIRRTVASRTRRSSARPASAPIPDTSSSADHDPANTDTGSW